MFEISYMDKTKKFIHIILEWTDEDVWDYIKTLGYLIVNYMMKALAGLVVLGVLIHERES